MLLHVNGHDAYAYTGAKPFDPSLPTVAFVHGAQNDHSVWLLQSRWFAHHGFGVLAVDLPGHGRSGGPPLPTIEDIADWIELLLEKAGAGDTTSGEKRVSLVGHSMGSLAVLECATRHPARIARAILVGTAVPMPVGDALLGAAQRTEGKAIAMINAWSHSPRATMGGYAVPGIWHLGASRRLMERQKPGVLHNDLTACNTYANGFAAAAAIACPTLVISGSRDQMTHPRAAAKLAAAIPGSRSVVIEGAGHALMAERPDAVLDALRSFIAA